MFRRLAPPLAVLAAMLVVPAIAQAHHITNMRATCTLYRNVPTLNFSAEFVSFSDADHNRHVTVKVDGDVAVSTDVFFDSDDYTWMRSVSTTSGTHEIDMLITWQHYDEFNNASFSKRVTCPAPVPPPKPPPPPTLPPKTVPPPVCAPGTIPTPGMTPPQGCHVTPPTPPRTKTVRKRVVVTTMFKNNDPFVAAPARAHRYRLTTSWSPRRPSGTIHAPTWVTFHVRGPHDLSGVRRWFIDGHRLHASRWVTLRKRSATIALFDLQAWAPGMGTGRAAWAQLYSNPHRVTYTAHRKVKVTAKAARSSWS